MTNGVRIMPDIGLIFASNPRTRARVDNFARFYKKTVFERARDRFIVLLNSGNQAGTQAVISVLETAESQGRGLNGYSELHTIARNSRLRFYPNMI